MDKILLSIIISLNAICGFSSQETSSKIDCEIDVFWLPDIVPHPMPPGSEPKPQRENEGDLA